MKPKHKVLYNTQETTIDPNEGNDAWHYMGTVDHTRMHISGKLYIGDASALKTPFNCHTSMPAAAAGIMAVGAAVGITSEDPPQNQSLVFTYLYPWFFAAGILVAGLGVMAHVYNDAIDKIANDWFPDQKDVDNGRPVTRKRSNVGGNLHYFLMPTSLGLIVTGVLMAKAARVERKQSLLSKDFSYHVAFGHAILVMLSVQTLFGILLAATKKNKTLWLQSPGVRKLHRWFGIGLLILLSSIALALLIPSKSPVNDFKKQHDIYIFGVQAAIVAAVAAVVAAYFNGPRLASISQRSSFQSFL